MSEKQKILEKLSIIITSTAFSIEDARELLRSANKRYIRNIERDDQSKIDSLKKNFENFEKKYSELIKK